MIDRLRLVYPQEARPWSDYGVISFPNVNRYTEFTVWLRSKEKPSKKETRYDLKLVRQKDKVLAGDWETTPR